MRPGSRQARDHSGVCPFQERLLKRGQARKLGVFLAGLAVAMIITSAAGPSGGQEDRQCSSPTTTLPRTVQVERCCYAFLQGAAMHRRATASRTRQSKHPLPAVRAEGDQENGTREVGKC